VRHGGSPTSAAAVTKWRMQAFHSSNPGKLPGIDNIPDNNPPSPPLEVTVTVSDNNSPMSPEVFIGPEEASTSAPQQSRGSHSILGFLGGVLGFGKGPKVGGDDEEQQGMFHVTYFSHFCSSFCH
jgi:hypothetical protein